MRSMEQRLVRLETTIRPQDREAEQATAEVRFEASLEAWDALVSTMADVHILILINEINQHGVRYRSGNLGVDMEGGNLARIASHMVAETVAGKLQGPLTLPREVAQVYVDDPDAHRLHDCESCGYMLPVRTSIRGQTPRRYFDHCPLCGGTAGYNAFGYTMQGQIQRCQRCGELQARTDHEHAHLRQHGRSECECS